MNKPSVDTIKSSLNFQKPLLCMINKKRQIGHCTVTTGKAAEKKKKKKPT